MARVIDEIIIRLLAPQQQAQPLDFEKGRRKVSDQLKKLGDKAKQQGEEIEGENKGLTDEFTKITTEAALFFAALEAAKIAERIIVQSE